MGSSGFAPTSSRVSWTGGYYLPTQRRSTLASRTPSLNAFLTQVRLGVWGSVPTLRLPAAWCSNFEASREGWRQGQKSVSPLGRKWQRGPCQGLGGLGAAPLASLSRASMVPGQGLLGGDNDLATRSDDTKNVPWDGTAPRPACRRCFPLAPFPFFPPMPLRPSSNFLSRYDRH